jgi:ribonuclease VapC
LPSQTANRASVLDSSAALAFLLSERGGHVVIPILEGGLLSTVNLAEIHARMIRLGAAAPHAWGRILSLQCEICPLTEAQARIAAELVPLTRPLGLSLGDRACLALALERKAKAYTADRNWKNLNLGIEIEVIR